MNNLISFFEILIFIYIASLFLFFVLILEKLYIYLILFFLMVYHFFLWYFFFLFFFVSFFFFTRSESIFMNGMLPPSPIDSCCWPKKSIEAFFKLSLSWELIGGAFQPGPTLTFSRVTVESYGGLDSII